MYTHTHTHTHTHTYNTNTIALQTSEKTDPNTDSRRVLKCVATDLYKIINID